MLGTSSDVQLDQSVPRAFQVSAFQVSALRPQSYPRNKESFAEQEMSSFSSVHVCPGESAESNCTDTPWHRAPLQGVL